MPIKDMPFSLGYPGAGSTYRPWLPLELINPHTRQSIKLLGLIDTGADDCAFPAGIATLIGHNLKKGG